MIKISETQTAIIAGEPKITIETGETMQTE
jgi:hypothetical protein